MDAAAWIEDVERRVERRLDFERSPRQLTVVFDPTCPLCQRCRSWMLGQRSYVPLSFVACSEEEARARFGDLPWLGNELIVVGDDGQVWVGPAAFLVCLWALVDWREWSFRLAAPGFAPLAERFFIALSGNRRALSALFRVSAIPLGHECANGSCRVR